MMWGRDDPGLIEDMRALATRLAYSAGWILIGLAVYLIVYMLDGIAHTAWRLFQPPSCPPTKFWDAIWAAFGAAFLATALAAAPLLRFILVTWNARYEEIRNRLNESALAAYLVQFWEKRFVDFSPGLKEHLDEYRHCARLLNRRYSAQASELFKIIYNEQYGQLAFLTPLILMLAVIAIETAIFVFLLANEPSLLDHKFAFPVYGAAAGTYMFVVGDSVMSARRRSLNISDLYWYALRLVLAVPLGLTIYKADGSMLDAFAVGSLPIDMFRKFFIQNAGKFLKFLETPAQDPDQLIQLDGVTAAISAQLGLEGISSIEQLVGSDPVSLAIRTGLPFKLILCIGAQAIVRRHLRMNAGPLAGIGLAHAEPVSLLLGDLRACYAPAAKPADTGQATSLWLDDKRLIDDPVIVNALACVNDNAAAQTPPVKTVMTAKTLVTAFQRIADESYTKFLMATDGGDNKTCNVKGCVPAQRICDQMTDAAPTALAPQMPVRQKASGIVLLAMAAAYLLGRVFRAPGIRAG
jgi:hypothetical protein